MNRVFLILLLVNGFLVFGNTYYYNDYIDNELITRTVEMDEYNNGYIIKSETKNETSVSIIDKDYVLIEQVTHDLKTDETRVLKIDNNKIFYNDLFIGNIKKKLGEPRSNAEFIAPWLEKNTDVLKFFAVQNKRNRKGEIIEGEMDQIPLYLKKIGRETVVYNGEEVDAIKVLFTIDNPIFSIFWKVHHWYRESDGLLLKYDTIKTPPGDPVLKGHLVGVEP